jgi:nucleotide-binding universal stress UspA family protein
LPVFHRILVGVDDSAAACRALARAVELAQEGHARIGLLTCAPRPASVIWAGPIAVPQSRAGMCAQLDQWGCGCIEAALAAVPPDVPVTKILRHGDPAAALREEAESGCWDVVVVGQASRRRLPFRRPVGERLRDVPIPVLVVHEEPRPEGSRSSGFRRASLLNRTGDRILRRRARPRARRAA